ncbi:Similar to LCC5: Laccase-5 (Trametes villosa) [Cotesia congregata]|uniref:Similar to LCC5: Laccase-5 (Trametes villosa) n=1 Tax=Cotesia congregata TaxID=51543 RepID=A0A8J2HDC2_COTCN|nr:Similar to LCC5: Laccase-5 (Trametes villosa) [Cotesia congregata]
MKLLGAIILTLLAVECWGTRVQSSKKKKEVAADQTAASSFWSPAIKTGNIFSQDDNSNFFSAGHGLVQTHPISSTFQSGFGGIDDLGTRGATVRPPRTRPLDYSERATAELRRNPSLSAPDECARACREGEPPRICYYHFTLEYYSVLGAACQVCTPNATNTVWSHCQCVLADGVERGILTANRMIPGPSIQVCEGDKVVVDVENHMQGMEATIHWHGVWQRGSQYYDGVPYVTQCPIQEGNTFRYQWTAGNAGTHFWHAHTGLQKIDGLYGSVIVRQPPSKDPNSNLYDYDLTTHVVLISDWMHEDAAERFPGRLAVNTGQDPETVLINGKGQFRDPNTGFMTNTPLEVFTVTPGRRYRFRLINSFGSVCPAQITFQGHELTLIATDGEPVQPVQVNTIISFSGERYDFVINADQPVGAYWIQLRGLGECGIKRAQQLGVLRYARGPYQPASQPPTYDLGLPQGVVLNPLDAICNMPRDDAVCVNQLKNAKPIDEGILQARPDVKIFLPFRFLFYRPEEVFQPNTYNRFLVAPTGDHVISLVDEISFTFPPAPPLSQIDDIPPEQFCNGDNRPADCGANCMCTHKVDIPHNAIVEVVLVDEVQQPNLSHPFHLHGYAFNVVGMGRSPDKNVKKINLKHALDLDRRGLLHREFNLPPSKDTIAVPNNGYVVFRFRADNPGYWLFHCHFLFHIVIGMNLVLHVGTHADLPPVPPNFPTCGDHLPPITPPLALDSPFH